MSIRFTEQHVTVPELPLIELAGHAGQRQRAGYTNCALTERNPWNTAPCADGDFHVVTLCNPTRKVHDEEARYVLREVGARGDVHALMQWFAMEDHFDATGLWTSIPDSWSQFFKRTDDNLEVPYVGKENGACEIYMGSVGRCWPAGTTFVGFIPLARKALAA
jgi:hypothetical protein